LLGLSLEESTYAQHDARAPDPAFSRRLYLDSLAYLLQGLPEDMSTEEQISLRAALPPGVVEPTNFPSGQPPSITFANGPQDNPTPSILHRILASIIVHLFLLFHFLLPHLKSFAQYAYTYERTHRISERLFAKSIDTVDTVGKRTLEVGETVGRMSDGRVGQLINGLASWWVEGVAGGVYEGVGEGMAVFGVSPAFGKGAVRAWGSQ
jgi:hypothetical protein